MKIITRREIHQKFDCLIQIKTNAIFIHNGDNILLYLYLTMLKKTAII